VFGAMTPVSLLWFTVQWDHLKGIQPEASGIQTWRAGKSWKIHQLLFVEKFPATIHLYRISQLATVDYLRVNPIQNLTLHYQ